MQTAIEEMLQEFGLNDKEVKIYLACLEIGPTFVSPISKKTEINRSTCYVLLEALLKKGLIFKSGPEKKLNFTAENPSRLISLLKERQSKYALLEKKLTKFMPELESLYNKMEGLPKIKLLEGIKAIKAVYEDIIKTVPEGGEYWHIGPDMEAEISLLGVEWTEQIIKSRRQKGIKSKALLERIAFTEQGKKKDKVEKRETVFLPKSKKPPARLHIYENKIAIFSLQKEITGVLIEDKNITEIMKMLFMSFWRECAK